MASLKQADRLMQFMSPLGKDVLLIESLEGAEGISRLFEYRAELLATLDTTIDPKSMIAARVSISIALNDAQGFRWINGIVAAFEQGPGDKEFNTYSARIVPAMWQLTLSSNCRIFQDKTVLDIAKSVIGEYGLSLSDQTNGSYQTLEYCTQYSESDFHFVSRILEESGIFYWFEHTDLDNKIMLGDGRNAYQDCPLSASFPYATATGGEEGEYGAWVSEFNATATMVSGKHATAEYNYKDYKREDVPDKASASPFGKNAYDEYLYPAGAEGYADGSKDVSNKLETLFLDARALAADAVAEVFRGGGNARSFCAGYTFSMTKNPRDAWNKKFLLTAVTHAVDQVPSYRAVEEAQKDGYRNQFTAVSSDITFKPVLTLGKPRIAGPQTAVVVGDGGEEINIDSQGRIKVRFFWDKKNDDSSTVDCAWVRVAQSWAGNGWGTYFWPRVKDEVVIHFLNGDPDNPMVTGSVYNGVNTPKYALPDNKTRSGLVTRSSTGGSGANANELRFEDKMGSEQIFIHAEKDMDVSIEHDRRISVGNNDSLIVTTNQTERIGANFGRQIKSNAVEQIGGNSDIGISGNLTESVGGNHSLNVSSNQSVQVGSAYSMSANNTIYINGGMSVVIQAGMELSLVASGNFITISPAGVAISGTMVLINSGGAPGTGTPGAVTSPATPATPDTAEGATSGSSGTAPLSSSSPPISSPPAPSLPSGIGSALSSVEGAAAGAVAQAAGHAGQDLKQAVDQAMGLADQAALQAQQAANQAEQAAQQAAQNAKDAVNRVAQDANQAVQQAQNALQQAQGAMNQAVSEGKAMAQQALNQATQAVQQCKQAATQAVHQAQQEAKQIEQQGQGAVNQAKDAAKQAEQQAQNAVQQATQAGKNAAEQAQRTAQDAANNAKRAAQQAQQQAQQAGKQVTQAASGAQQQAQQASSSAQQAAGQALKGF